MNKIYVTFLALLISNIAFAGGPLVEADATSMEKILKTAIKNAGVNSVGETTEIFYVRCTESCEAAWQPKEPETHKIFIATEDTAEFRRLAAQAGANQFDEGKTLLADSIACYVDTRSQKFTCDLTKGIFHNP
jgi:hypothetical protein